MIIPENLIDNKVTIEVDKNRGEQTYMEQIVYVQYGAGGQATNQVKRKDSAFV